MALSIQPQNSVKNLFLWDMWRKEESARSEGHRDAVCGSVDFAFFILLPSSF
jgi:hypothetical protein